MPRPVPFRSDQLAQLGRRLLRILDQRPYRGRHRTSRQARLRRQKTTLWWP